MKTTQIIGLTLLLAAFSCPAEEESKPPTLQGYMALHDLVANPKDPKWVDSMRQLSKVGDAFTLEHLKGLEAQKLDPSRAEVLKETISAINQRAAKEDAQTFSKLIEVRLERAAWADLGCDRLEITLVPWTLKFLREHIKTPGAVTELKRIQSQYVPALEQKTLYSSMQERVRDYAGRILGK